jgi:cytochrome c553
MRNTAGRAAAATEIEDLAIMAGSMLALCGDCHRAVGVTPPLRIAGKEPQAGGTVLHMLEHKRAVDFMLEGLMGPSPSAWTQGAKLLSKAPLRRSDLALDATTTREVLNKERDIHALAKRGVSANDARSRLYIYSEILQSCSACHSLHPKMRGRPNRQ